jgi:hypothetical protein
VTWLPIVLMLLGVLILMAFALWVLGTRQIAKGQPTPAEAQIEAETKAAALVIVNEGETTKSEVLHADRDGLLARLRDRVRGK